MTFNDGDSGDSECLERIANYLQAIALVLFLKAKRDDLLDEHDKSLLEDWVRP